MKGKGRLTLTGPAGRRDEGVGAGRALLRAHARAAVRHQGRVLRHATTSTSTCPRAPSPRTARRPASPWPPPCSRCFTEPAGAARGGHDRRDHAARQRAADRRAQGEDAGRAPRRASPPSSCPKLNKKELDEIPTHLKRGLEVHLVDEVDEVLRLALIPPLEARPRPAAPSDVPGQAAREAADRLAEDREARKRGVRGARPTRAATGAPRADSRERGFGGARGPSRNGMGVGPSDPPEMKQASVYTEP